MYLCSKNGWGINRNHTPCETPALKSLYLLFLFGTLWIKRISNLERQLNLTLPLRPQYLGRRPTG